MKTALFLAKQGCLSVLGRHTDSGIFISHGFTFMLYP